MSLRQPPVPRTRRAARGAVSVMAAVLIATVAIAALVSVDVGHVFMRQRQLQNMVDLAAMSAAQQLKRADSAANLNAAVLGTVSNIGAKNGYPSGIAMGCAAAAGGGADAMTACVGVWDPATAGPRHFSAVYNAATVSPNAVRVQATQTVPILFVFKGGSGRQLFAESIASGSPPVAAFSLGTGLLDVSTANSMLSVLLGNAVNLSLADWQGLVNTTVTLDQLRLEADVGTVEQLLSASLSLRDFYALVLGAAGRDTLLNTMLGSPPTALAASGAAATVSLARLLDLGLMAPAASSAVEVGLNVAQLLLAGAQVARGDTAVALPLNIPTLPLGLGGISANLRVIQPPVTAAGPARQLSSKPDTWQTSATSAQVRLTLALQIKADILKPVIDADLNVPLFLDVANATADLTRLQCAANPADRRATMQLRSGLATACLTDGCTGGEVVLGEVKVGLLGDIAQVVATDVPRHGNTVAQEVTLAPGGHAQVGMSDPFGGVFSQVLSLKVRTKLLGILSLPLDVGPLLAPLGATLDGLVPPLLNSLGIQLGNADLWVHSIDCNNAELVY
ncbi:pilus assembly protein TadG-related protein [Cupriavidus sp. WGlv3]|uniref:TadG family pilus assembly protein n=1 Tax=Cupriavidus sp. WGlv3 TaxID=2919924 RepID=UPI002090AFB4|nr:TadG family pilus assembly protein [Cupriavidus sp. WGlv3]MCO4863667.1 pilus assembly protein TadG-related protein [Cupriavidus sp. WGlv3]